MSTSKILIGTLAFAVTLSACSKKVNHDVKGDPDVRIFFNNTSAGNAPHNSIAYTVTNRPGGTAGQWVNLNSTIPQQIKIPVFATRPLSESLVVNAELDNTLIAEYNAANDTEYEPFPQGFLNTNNLVANFSNGSSRAEDSISIAADLSDLSAFDGRSFMAPIRLTSISKENVGAFPSSVNSRIAYIVVDSYIQYINFEIGPDDMSGTMVDDRSPWEINFNPAPTDNGSVVDGSSNSYTRWGNTTSAEVTVNMIDVHNVTGLRLSSSNFSSVTPTSIEVLISEDGINYQSLGYPSRNDLTFTGGYTYIAFYAPMQAQYIRLNLNYQGSTHSQNRRLAELDIYTQ